MNSRLRKRYIFFVVNSLRINYVEWSSEEIVGIRPFNALSGEL
jgi:hypothetical protein